MPKTQEKNIELIDTETWKVQFSKIQSKQILLQTIGVTTVAVKSNVTYPLFILWTDASAVATKSMWYFQWHCSIEKNVFLKITCMYGVGFSSLAKIWYNFYMSHISFKMYLLSFYAYKTCINPTCYTWPSLKHTNTTIDLNVRKYNCGYSTLVKTKNDSRIIFFKCIIENN